MKPTPNYIVILRYIVLQITMGVTKSELFTEEQNMLALYAKALAHPARIAIIHYLVKTNACINSDLVDELGLAQATISQHLRELKSLGIIQGTIEGVSISYCINSVKWDEIKLMFNTLFEKYEQVRKDCC